MKKVIEKTAIILMFAVMLMWGWNGLISGFAWEHVIAEFSARIYIEWKYKFHVTEMRSSIVLDYPVRVGVRVKELDFPITVNMSRKTPLLLPDNSDDYLDELAKNLLEKDFRQFVKNVTNSRAYAYLSFRRQPSLDMKLTEQEIKSEALYEKTKNEYQCVIIFDGLKKDEELNVDYDLYFKIFQYITNSKLKPYEIWFRWYDKDVQEKGSTTIHSIGFGSDKYDQIKSGEDLKKFIKIEPKK